MSSSVAPRIITNSLLIIRHFFYDRHHLLRSTLARVPFIAFRCRFATCCVASIVVLRGAPCSRQVCLVVQVLAKPPPVGSPLRRPNKPDASESTQPPDRLPASPLQSRLSDLKVSPEPCSLSLPLPRSLSLRSLRSLPLELGSSAIRWRICSTWARGKETGSEAFHFLCDLSRESQLRGVQRTQAGDAQGNASGSRSAPAGGEPRL